MQASLLLVSYPEVVFTRHRCFTTYHSKPDNRVHIYLVTIDAKINMNSYPSQRYAK